MRQVLNLMTEIKLIKENSCFFLIAMLLMFMPINSLGQKHCADPPTLILSEISGSTCYMTPITVSNNTFGGSATSVTITENGRGSVIPSSTSSSPFSFTYIPDSRDAGLEVTITVTTNNPEGSPCRAARATFLLNVNSNSQAPIIENIIQPSCTLSTGTVELSGLPVYSSWTITVSPGGMTLDGSGSTATIPNLSSGTYTFTVSVSTECSSLASEQAQILTQPTIPTPPDPGSITAPTCLVPTGSISLTGLPSSGTWTLTLYPGTVTTTGSGTMTTVSGLNSGIYNFTVTNDAGCVSGLSSDIIIPAPPSSPPAPVIGIIRQPTFETPTGSVTLTGLPSSGPWTIIRNPGEVAIPGSGSAITINGLEIGTYTFRVRNNLGCSSPESVPVIISAPVVPVVIITDPPPVCFPATVDLTVPEIKDGSTPGLIYSYWTDAEATIALENSAEAPHGTYYIKGTSLSGYFDIKPVNVIVIQPPVSNAGPDQVLELQFNTILNATLAEGETGSWVSDSAGILFNDVMDPSTSVSNLPSGENILSWIVTNGVCPADTDYVSIIVGELLIPSLITPNGDQWNEYFVIKGIESLGTTELTVFDRRGIQIFWNKRYDNKWNGVDYSGKPLINDTYFYILKSVKGNSFCGYIVIRR